MNPRFGPHYPAFAGTRFEPVQPMQQSAQAKKATGPQKPFRTQTQQRDALAAKYDALKGPGAFARLIQARARQGGFTLKSQITFLSSELAMLTPSALIAPSPTVPTPPCSPARQVPKTAKPAAETALVMTQRESNKLSPFERGTFQARGGTVVAETITRAAFDKLSPAAQLDFAKNGGRLTD
jgi:hypothetical protein